MPTPEYSTFDAVLQAAMLIVIGCAALALVYAAVATWLDRRTLTLRDPLVTPLSEPCVTVARIEFDGEDKWVWDADADARETFERVRGEHQP